MTPPGRIVIVLLALLGAGCVPFYTETFYRPEAPGGTVVPAMCPPVRSFVLIERQGVVVGARAQRASAESVWTTVTFEVPEGKVVRLLEREVRVTLPSGSAATGTLTGTVRTGAFKTRPVSPDEPLVGQSPGSMLARATPYGKRPHGAFTFHATVAAREADVLVLTLPRIVVDEAEVALPAIRLVRDSEFFWAYPLNC